MPNFLGPHQTSPLVGPNMAAGFLGTKEAKFSCLLAEKEGGRKGKEREEKEKEEKEKEERKEERTHECGN